MSETADATAHDERDELISLKASRNAYGVLSASLIIVLLLLALTLGGITVYASRIFYYRRGY